MLEKSVEGLSSSVGEAPKNVTIRPGTTFQDRDFSQGQLAAGEISGMSPLESVAFEEGIPNNHVLLTSPLQL